MDFRDRILYQIADEIFLRITRKVIRNLQSNTTTLSGDDSGLKNAWDEICVQVQDEYSIYWEDYLSVVNNYVQHHVSELNEFEKRVSWLFTKEGEDWYFDNFDKDVEVNEIPVFEDGLIEFIVNEHVLGCAENWNNKRIEKYIISQRNF